MVGTRVPAAYETGVQIERALELLEPRQQDRPVITNHGQEARVVSDAEVIRARQVFECWRVLGELELAESAERPGRTVFGFELEPLLANASRHSRCRSAS